MKMIGEHLQRVFADVLRRPMGWSLIDTLARIEEQEEALRNGEERNDRGHDQPRRKDD